MYHILISIQRRYSWTISTETISTIMLDLVQCLEPKKKNGPFRQRNSD